MDVKGLCQGFETKPFRDREICNVPSAATGGCHKPSAPQTPRTVDAVAPSIAGKSYKERLIRIPWPFVTYDTTMRCSVRPDEKVVTEPTVRIESLAETPATHSGSVCVRADMSPEHAPWHEQTIEAHRIPPSSQHRCVASGGLSALVSKHCIILSASNRWLVIFDASGH